MSQVLRKLGLGGWDDCSGTPLMGRNITAPLTWDLR